jgi:hypothetical protein
MLNALTIVDDEQSAMRHKTAALPSLCDLLGPTAPLWSADKRENLCTAHPGVNLTPANGRCRCEHAREQENAEHDCQQQNQSDGDDDFAAHGEAA